MHFDPERCDAAPQMRLISKGVEMPRRVLSTSLWGCLVCLQPAIASSALAAASAQSGDSAAPVEHSISQTTSPAAQNAQAQRTPADLVDRIFKREKQQVETIENSAPIVETYIQEEKSDPLMGTVPKKDLYFLGQGDFRGKTMKVHSMTAKTHSGSFLWSFEPSGFLQMAFLDLRDFDKEHYRLTPPPARRREFLGDVRCYVFDVERTAKAKGPRFRGRIWVEDQDFTIVRINGIYAPEANFSLRHFEDEFYLHFDSWRTTKRKSRTALHLNNREDGEISPRKMSWKCWSASGWSHPRATSRKC